MRFAPAALAAAFLFAAVAVEAHPGRDREPDYAKLQAELKLTDQQLAAFKAEQERHREALRVFHEDTRARGKLLHEEHRDRLGKVLNEEQIAKLREMHEERRETRRERMDHKGH